MGLFDLAQPAYKLHRSMGWGRHVIGGKGEDKRQGVNGLNWDSVKTAEYKNTLSHTSLSTLLKGRLPCC